MTRSSEKTPLRVRRSTTRSARVEASATEDAPSRTRRLSAASTSRADSVTRWRGMERRSGCAAARPTSASTPGSPRSRAWALSARGKLGGQAPRALDQLRQLGGHGLLPHVATHGVHEIRLPARGGDAFETRLHPELAGLAEAKGAHLAVDLNVGGGAAGPHEHREGGQGLALERRLALAATVGVDADGGHEIVRRDHARILGNHTQGDIVEGQCPDEGAPGPVV